MPYLYRYLYCSNYLNHKNCIINFVWIAAANLAFCCRFHHRFWHSISSKKILMQSTQGCKMCGHLCETNIPMDHVDISMPVFTQFFVDFFIWINSYLEQEVAGHFSQNKTWFTVQSSACLCYCRRDVYEFNRDNVVFGFSSHNNLANIVQNLDMYWDAKRLYTSVLVSRFQDPTMSITLCLLLFTDQLVTFQQRLRWKKLLTSVPYKPKSSKVVILLSTTIMMVKINR